MPFFLYTVDPGAYDGAGTRGTQPEYEEQAEQSACQEGPPGLAFHVLDGSGRLTGHFRVVP
ncbi:hypothetical protein [Streptomyces tuirus]